jgi:hypothetical protein
VRIGTFIARLPVWLVLAFFGAATGASAQVTDAPEQFRTMALGDPASIDREGLNQRFGILVTHGDDVPSGMHNTVVRISFRATPASTRESVCTGIRLLGRNVVLTAAHCSCGVLGTYRFVTKETFDKLVPGQPIAGEWRAVRYPARYPGYDCALPPEAQPGKDLAVFFVFSSDDKDFSRNADSHKPEDLVRFASMHQVRDAGDVYLLVAGFGVTETGDLPHVLQQGLIRIGSHFCSRGAFGGTACEGFREFALGSEGPSGTPFPVDTCNGDSGGPVFWYPPNAVDIKGVSFQPPAALVGITSRALAVADHLPGMLCGGGGVYTAVGHSAVIDWLWSLGVTVRTVESHKPRPQPG